MTLVLTSVITLYGGAMGKYTGKKRNSTQKNRTVYTKNKNIGMCSICGNKIKIYNNRIICNSCKNKINELQNKGKLQYAPPIHTILYLKLKLNKKNILDYLIKFPYMYEQTLNHSSKSVKKQVFNRQKIITEQMSINKRYPEVEIIKVFQSSNKEVFYYRDKRTKIEFADCCDFLNSNKVGYHLSKTKNLYTDKLKHYKQLKMYLKRNNICYFKYYDTLPVHNPLSGIPMHYDIEIPFSKLMILIKQDNYKIYDSNTYHSLENAQYQSFMDKKREEYAKKNKYKILYLTHNDFVTGLYTKKIKKVI